ncbi:transposase [Algoriphagus resistens]|uniref:transposase n=1 Tax=Algoriphagus resistens TaxID=1750590 RepID=UPI0009E6FDB0|nr:transposase [Algoriphagus resistens]
MHRKFDDSFKIMSVDLSIAKGSVAEVARELDIDPSLLSKWRRNPRYIGNKVLPDNPKISPEQQGIERFA